ncbi:MAG: hypothetical protein JWO60_3126 [Frankiales bacterium]|nr:hypothetical protein [Frankiales bacterium]
MPAGAVAPSQRPSVTSPSTAVFPQYNGECEPAGPDVLDRLALLQPSGVAVRLVSGWSLLGERGTVVGGYLSGTDHGALIDGAFASWYIRAADDTVHRYTDNALTLSAWPQLGDGQPTPLSLRVKACAAANAG